MIPQLQSPPRVRVEWLIAGARIVLAAGTLLSFVLQPEWGAPAAAYLMGWYLIYSLALVALVWTPIRFARGWDISVHIVDVCVFALWSLLTDGLTGPLVVFYVFVMVCAMLRWQIAGTIWTAVAAIGAHLTLTLALADAIPAAALLRRDLVPHVISLVLIAALIAFLGAHHSRFQYEISRLAAWPRTPMRAQRDVLAEILRQASEFLRAPRIVLVWEEPGEGWVNVAWWSESGDGVEWTQEPEAAYGSFVVPGLEQSSFQVTDAADERGRVLLLRPTGFRRRRCRPVHEGLRARFAMHAVQSWPLNGELTRGRLFCLDKRRMRLDELVLGEVVASLAVTRLESHYWQDRLRAAAAIEERVRLARDVHDNLLQAQAGAALQLLAARRLLDRDPDAGRQRLADVQQQMERDELEIRSFVMRLRPEGRSVPSSMNDLGERLAELRQRVERQWPIHVNLELDAVDALPADILEGAYRLVQESIINAARHADASVVNVALSRVDGALRLRVADDGRGFPFHGTYDLAALDRMKNGPRTLRERVADLGGDLTLVSSDTGAELHMRLPLAKAEV